MSARSVAVAAKPETHERKRAAARGPRADSARDGAPLPGAPAGMPLFLASHDPARSADRAAEGPTDAGLPLFLRGSGSAPAPPADQVAALPSLARPGSALPTEARRDMEGRFGADFSGVRIHTDGQAAEDARGLRARAFTVGHHVVFGEGRFAPGTGEGRHLLAHELTHVLQQGAAGQARIDRFADCGAPEDCPPRERGEVAAASGGGMDVLGVRDPLGMLVANFAIGSGTLKEGLADDPRFTGYVGQMRAAPELRFAILGFTDCEGAEETNTPLRQARAQALLAALPPDVHAQITSTGGAAMGSCMQDNATAQGRRQNRSAFLQQTGAEYTLEEVVIEAARPAPSTLYGVTSPATEYFVRASPDGERVGMLVMREMRVEIIANHGSTVEDLWLEVRFSPEDMALLVERYAEYMESHVTGLPALQGERERLEEYIQLMQRRPGLAFEVQGQLERARSRLAEIRREIQQIEAHQARQVTPFTGTTVWVGAKALGIVAMHYDTFLDLIDDFDADFAHEPLRDRLTRLRQIGEDPNLQGDVVVGRTNPANPLRQHNRPVVPGSWQLFLEGKQIRMPNGEFVDAHHFVLGIDALALPASQMSVERSVSHPDDFIGIAPANVGESFAAATWSGDVGGAAGDYVMHNSRSWEQAHTSENDVERLLFYFRTRAPEADLLADIDAWGAFGDVPETSTAPSSFTTLREVFEAHYGPAGQTATEYETKVAGGRRVGVATFLCYYGFTSPTGLLTQTEAVQQVLEQVQTFARAWYDVRSGTLTAIFGHSVLTEVELLVASRDMTLLFLLWLERLAARVGVAGLSCGE